MQPTAKIYETDPFVRQFTATVLACRHTGAGFAVALDQTAFYPEGGGQPCDTGALNGAAVTAVHSADGVIWHETDTEYAPGATVQGVLDWARRRDHMEQHTGEHILSGTLHRLFGAENVGFHIGQPAVRMDMSLPLAAAQLAQAEEEANAAIRADLPVRCWYPAARELPALPYRSKKELDGPVRLVDAGGADLCACCGTHLATTGQVGLIKILSAQSYKGGVRLAVACGQRAADAVAGCWQDAAAAGALLSVPVGGLAGAAQRLLDAQGAEKLRTATLQHTLADACAQNAQPGRPAVLLCPGVDGDGLRQIAVRVTAATAAFCAALAPREESGALAYALAGPPDTDIRPLCKAMNARFDGRGGGKPGFCQGSLPAAGFAAVKDFLENNGGL